MRIFFDSLMVIFEDIGFKYGIVVKEANLGG